jgi:hypothetical protein
MTPSGYMVLSVGVHMHGIEDRTYYHPCVVSNHPFVTTNDGKIADELKKVGSDWHLISCSKYSGIHTSLMYGLIERDVIGSARRIKSRRNSCALGSGVGFRCALSR